MLATQQEQHLQEPVVDHEFTSSQELLEVLRPSHEYWSGPYRLWGFRGQACASWSLVPRAFRESFERFLPSDRRTAPGLVFDAHAENEIAAFEDFAFLADEIGHAVPGMAFLMSEEYALKRRSHAGWPFAELMEGLALAQHHGTPTRLLDMTYSPLVAAFYAAYQRWRDGGPGNAFRSTHLCVWAVNLHFVHHSYRNALSRRIDTLNVPSASNPYLHAQRAHFIWDREANTSWPPDPIDRVIAARATAANAWECAASRPTHLSRHIRQPVIRRLLVPHELTTELLSVLAERERVSLAHLMPSPDRVTESYELLRDLSEATPDDAALRTAPARAGTDPQDGGNNLDGTL